MRTEEDWAPVKKQRAQGRGAMIALMSELPIGKSQSPQPGSAEQGLLMVCTDNDGWSQDTSPKRTNSKVIHRGGD